MGVPRLSLPRSWSAGLNDKLCFMENVMNKRLLTAVIAVTAILFAAGAEAVTTNMCVDVLKTKKVTFEHGPTTAYLFKMNGEDMVAIPENMAPDSFHQQLLRDE